MLATSDAHAEAGESKSDASASAAHASIVTPGPSPTANDTLRLASVPVREPEIVTAPPDPDNQRAPFIVQIGELLIPYRVFAVYVTPGETIAIDTIFDESGDSYDLLTADGTIEKTGENRWRWTAPDEAGLYPLIINDPSLQAAVRIHAFVTVPLANVEDEHLNGYRIGSYPSKPLRNNPRYNSPEGLVEVTPENRDTLIAPHFRLGQFLTKQGGDWPRYVALDERLLLKLELILGAVRREGISADTLFIMSGYRTPYYNKRIGNVQYSRHVYGDAADVFIDVDGDNRMDDLNGDGKSDFEDAEFLASIVESLAESDPFVKPLVGGIGRYGPKPHRGPFVHVDTRGYAARWDSR